MKIRKLLPLLSIALLVSGCGKGATITDGGNVNKETSEDQSFTAILENEESTEAETESSASEESTDAETEATSTAAEESTESTVEAAPEENPNGLSASELSEFTTLFNTPEYKGFLDQPFNNPEDISLYAVFYYGAGIDVKDVSDDEISDYLKAADLPQVYGDLYVMRGDDFNKFFETHLGTSAPQKLPGDPWTYVAERDSYYFYHWSSEQDKISYKCVSGEKDGDRYSLRFELDTEKHYERYADRIVTFTKNGDTLRMESNSFMWNDNCDIDQTFDVEIYPGENPVHFVTYLPDPVEGVKMDLIKDGKLLTSVATTLWNGTNNTPLTKVNAVSFFDFNADGVKDILVIGDSEWGEQLILEESVLDQDHFRKCYGIIKKLNEELAGNMSVASVKAKLLGDNTECKFDSYQAAYAHIANLYNLADEECTYGLINADADDIPELVIDTPSASTSLYSYKNGTVQCLMYQWAYGAMGNYGYMYAPGKGVYLNHNNDYAGAIQYDSYMTYHEGSEISTDFSIETLFFKDTDGDKIPSEEELGATDEMIDYESFYHNYTDTEMTEDEIKAKISEYNSYQYEDLRGNMSYDEFINSLK